LDTLYKSNLDLTDDEYNVEELDDGPGPFKCYVDTELMRTTIDARIFGAIKGIHQYTIYNIQINYDYNNMKNVLLVD